MVGPHFWLKDEESVNEVDGIVSNRVRDSLKPCSGQGPLQTVSKKRAVGSGYRGDAQDREWGRRWGAPRKRSPKGYRESEKEVD